MVQLKGLGLKRNLLSVALVSAVMMSAATANAQDAAQPAQEEAEQEDAKTLDTVTVTGIRASIEKSIDTKQSSTSIVEAISAEDIGKLPDTSIADSLARLPGLTAQRFGSRPQEINIRGFAGDFSTALLNGREQVSPGNNRGVEFDQYPSELVNQVVVYKTPDASLIGQGLSGTVDLRTVRPLDFKERVIAANLRGDLNKVGDEKEHGSRFSFSYIDQFADNTVGVALGYARLNNPVQGHQFESWGYPNGVMGGGKLYAIGNENERDGFMAVLEFRPTDAYSTTLDLFYSKFDKEETKRGMEFGFEWGAAGPPDTRVDNANGTAIEATFDNFRPIMRNDFNSTYDDLFSIGWNNELRLSDHWTVRADISASSVNRDERLLETYAGLQAGMSDNITIRANPDGYFDFDFGLDYSDPSLFRLVDAGGWGQDGYIKDFEVKDSLTSLRLDFERTFDAGMLSSLEFGANITDRSKSRASNEAFLCLQSCRDGASLPIPSGLLTESGFGFAGLDGVLGYDAMDALRLYNRRSNAHPDISNKNWQVDEKVTTLFVQANINTDLGPIPVRGNLGVQVVNADQSSAGAQSLPGNAVGVAIAGGANITDVLPSLNLSFQLPAEQFVRVAAARQMARPRMDQMRANENIGFDANRVNQNGTPNDPSDDTLGVWTRNGGTPELEPWIADAYDLSYEKYFGNKGYVSAAYFYKDLKTYIYDETTAFDIRDVEDFPPALYPPNAPLNPIGEYRRPINGEGGKIYGHELAVSIPFDLLWAPLEGFGFSANYSDTKSKIQPSGPGTTDVLPGLSKYVSNASVYFERWGFSARVSQRHRSAFVGEVQGFGGDRSRRVFEGETVTDVQLGYAFQSGPLENLSLLLQVNNLENEPFRSTYDGMDDRPREYFEYGRTYLFGVSYRF